APGRTWFCPPLPWRGSSSLVLILAASLQRALTAHDILQERFRHRFPRPLHIASSLTVSCPWKNSYGLTDSSSGRMVVIGSSSLTGFPTDSFPSNCDREFHHHLSPTARAIELHRAFQLMFCQGPHQFDPQTAG